MRLYYSVFRIRFIHSLQYRTVALGQVLSRFSWGIMEILAYIAIYSTGVTLPMDLSQTVSYLWIQQTLLTMFSVVFSDNEIYTAISSGSIAYELVRPVSLYTRWFCQSAANRIAPNILGCLPVLFAASLLPKPYRLSLPPHPGQFFLFLLSALLAVCVVVSFAMLMYILLFYVISQRGVKIIATAVTSFFSGGVLPLPFFPEPVLAVVRLLPFAAMQNMPLQIYSGTIFGMAALKGIVFQIFWLTVLVLTGRTAMRRALKKVIVQGG